MLEALRYGPVKRAANRALAEISPLVPTRNKPALPESEIVPPHGLEGFWKQTWNDPDMRLEHQTPDGVKPYIYTAVERNGDRLRVTESLRDGSKSLYTELLFEKNGVRGHSWVNREDIKKPLRKARRRIKNTLSPRPLTSY